MSKDLNIDTVLNLLFGYAEQRSARLKRRRLQFAHYTSADVAAQILLKRDIWMRNASSMNDYMEVAFGSKCLKKALGQFGDRFQAAIDVARPNLCHECLEWLGRADFNHHQHTHLTSLSEHRRNDDLGLLSMWRAYGGPVAGVALIFTTEFLDMDSEPLGTWSIPVVYGEHAYLAEFEKLVVSLERSSNALQAVDPDTLKNLVFNALHFSILSAKHIGFREEREWRVIHGPRESASAWVTPSFESVRGKPEVIYHLPLQNKPGLDLPMLDLTRLIDRVIIGPCTNPYQVASTFEDILRHVGFAEPSKHIKISHIPLRQQG